MITFNRPVEEGSDRCKLRDSSCLGIFRGSIFKINLAVRWVEPNLWPKIGLKSTKIAQIHISRTVCRRKLVDPSKWPRDLLYYGCYNDEIAWFSIHLHTTAGMKMAHPSRWIQEPIFYGCSKVLIHVRQPEVPKNVFFRPSISRKLYIILNWLTFHNDRKTLLSNRLKWEFQIFFKWDFHNLFSEISFTITHMPPIGNNQWKINFCIVGANFRHNIGIFAHYSILSTSREFIFANAILFSLFFLSLLVFKRR